MRRETRSGSVRNSECVPTFVAELPLEAGVAIAHLPRGRGGPHVHALSVAAAVLVLGAVVLELTTVTVEPRVAAAAAGERPAVAAAAVLAVLAGRRHGDVGAGPEAILGRPLAGLADEPQGAVLACEAVGKCHGEALRPATSLLHGNFCSFLSPDSRVIADSKRCQYSDMEKVVHRQCTEIWKLWISSVRFTNKMKHKKGYGSHSD